MANTNPWKARLTRHAKRWPQPIEALQAQAYGVLQVAFEGVTVEDAEQRRKNILCFFQGVTAFNRLHETVELERRLTILEQRLTSAEVYSRNGTQP
jgi:hypothetical protein